MGHVKLFPSPLVGAGSPLRLWHNRSRFFDWARTKYFETFCCKGSR